MAKGIAHWIGEKAIGSFVVGASLALAAPALAQTQIVETFYAGRTITVIVGSIYRGAYSR